MCGLKIAINYIYSHRGRGKPNTGKPHLLVLLQDGVLESQENVDGSLVLVLQRGPHHQVIVGVLVEVGDGGNAGAESGILVTLEVHEGPAGDKEVLPRGKRRENNSQRIGSKAGKRREPGAKGAGMWGGFSKEGGVGAFPGILEHVPGE